MSVLFDLESPIGEADRKLAVLKAEFDRLQNDRPKAATDNMPAQAA